MNCSLCGIERKEENMKWIQEKKYRHFMKVCSNCAESA
jgi:hypothetical protein